MGLGRNWISRVEVQENQFLKYSFTLLFIWGKRSRDKKVTQICYNGVNFINILRKFNTNVLAPKITKLKHN